MTDRLGELTAAGVAVWLDDLSRTRLTSGGLDRLRREKHLVGVTSNPTIFAKALSDADEYNWQLHDLAIRAVTVEEAARMITTYDVRWACDVLKPVAEAIEHAGAERGLLMRHLADQAIRDVVVLSGDVRRPCRGQRSRRAPE